MTLVNGVSKIIFDKLHNYQEMVTSPKIVNKVMKHGSKVLIKRVHKDRNTVVLALNLFLEPLLKRNSEDGFREAYISSIVLQKRFKKIKVNYLDVIRLLQRKTSLYTPILEVSKSYKVGVRTKLYKLVVNIEDVTFEKILSNKIIEDRIELSKEYLEIAVNHPIGCSLLRTYEYVKLPSVEEVLVQGEELIKQGYHYKGKKMVRLSANKNEISLKDAIIRYKTNIVNGRLMIPIILNERNDDLSGSHRVYDSFSIMQKFIRNMVTIDNEQLTELDYKCLHPNIAVSLYGEKLKEHVSITHEELAQKLDLPIQEVKILHLKFFNDKVDYMVFGEPSGLINSPLYEYYNNVDSKFIENILLSKKEDYKNTYYQMEEIEVAIMDLVSISLYDRGIKFLYIYDAIMVKKKDAVIASEIMNESARYLGVNTTV